MATLFVLVNENGEVIGARRQDSTNPIDRAKESYRGLQFTLNQATALQQPDLMLFVYEQTTRAINESTQLTADQRAEVIAEYNRLLPGDSIKFVSPDVHGDNGKAANPVFIYFIDP